MLYSQKGLGLRLERRKIIVNGTNKLHDQYVSNLWKKLNSDQNTKVIVTGWSSTAKN